MSVSTTDDLKELQMKQIIALSLENVPEYKIAEQLKLSRYAVKKIRNSEEFKTELKRIGDEAVATAKEQFKAGLNEMAPLALKALKHNLEENKIEAVRVFVETVGLKEKEKSQDHGPIQILLPGTTVENVIPTESKELPDGEV